MQVILLKDVRGLGRKGELKEVKEGYARNLLLPQKTAEIATPEALKKLATRKATESAEKQAQHEAAKQSVLKLAKEIFEFRLKAGEHGEVYGSVTAKHVEEELARRGYAHTKVLLPHPVKELGSFAVEIDFGNEIKTALTMRAVREE